MVRATGVADAVVCQSAGLVDLTKGITHEIDANHGRDSADCRKRIGAALRSALSSGEHAGGRQKGTVQHAEHENHHADRSENPAATSRGTYRGGAAVHSAGAGRARRRSVLPE